MSKEKDKEKKGNGNGDNGEDKAQVFRLKLPEKKKKTPGKVIPGGAGANLLYELDFPIDSQDALIQAFWSPEWLMICQIEDGEKKERQAKKFLERMPKNNDLFGLRLYVVNVTGRVENAEGKIEAMERRLMVYESILGDADAICKALYEPFYKRWFKMFIVRVARNRVKRLAKKNAKEVNALREKARVENPSVELPMDKLTKEKGESPDEKETEGN